ncbi:BON domain-containing protein [Methylomonas paludis]|uniref:BON domain-containing protein n=1 Tax=Methylomonas paludis TaxID=1173101 RepID=A0A975MKD9_9GAMM|nr:BON domain-containing protein [Methylomonas paludis]QWF69397.1 BON domain-containing protein [Methylomonas paludis]
MKIVQTPQSVMLAVSLISAVVALTACEKEGTAEKAGAKIDHAAEKAGNELDKAKLSINQKAETADVYIDDSVITAKVKEAILADAILKVGQIEVTTVNGVVKLSGKLASAQQVNKAIELVGSLKNVKSVTNDLSYPADTTGK